MLKSNTPHHKMKIGDTIKIGKEIWEVTDIKIKNGYSEASYKIINSKQYG